MDSGPLRGLRARGIETLAATHVFKQHAAETDKALKLVLAHAVVKNPSAVFDMRVNDEPQACGNHRAALILYRRPYLPTLRVSKRPLSK